MRVIFWDVDGVLNNPGTYGAWKLLGHPDSLEPALVARAAALTRELGARCVLSSTWRYGGPTSYRGRLVMAGYLHTIECLERMGWTTARFDFIDHTPFIKGPVSRGAEIGAWLLEHPDVAAYVIVDDDDMTSHRGQLVHVNGAVGLTEADVERARELMKDPGSR